MTDDKSNDTLVSDAALWIAKDREHTRLRRSLFPENKSILFHALSQFGITRVTVTFDGYSDSGQIEDIVAHAADLEVGLPAGEIEIACVEWGATHVAHRICSIRDTVEHLAYECLEDTHAGWENNAGAFGEFTFDVAESTITLDYNERFEDSEYTQHIF